MPPPISAAAATSAARIGPRADPAAFVARVMGQSERALEHGTIPTLDVLASWFRPGIAAAVAALILGFLFGRGILTPAPTSIDAAMAQSEGPGLAALVTAADPPDASVVFASLVEQH